MLQFDYNRSIKKKLIKFQTNFIHRRRLKDFKRNYDFFIKIVNYALNKRKGYRDDKFLECFLVLVNKLLIDIQSCKILWERGLYGTTFGLCSVLQRSVRMLGGLHLKPELIEDYLEEEKNSTQNKEFMNKFSEGAIQRVLDERFGKRIRGPYANIEKSLHGSSVGAKIFYAKIRHNSNKTRGGDIKYDAFFEKEKSTGILNILCAVPIDISGIFLERYQKENDISWLKIEYDELLVNELKQ